MSRLKLKTKWNKFGRVPVWENKHGLRIHVSSGLGGLIGEPGKHFLCVTVDRAAKQLYDYFYKITGGNRKRSLMGTTEALYGIDPGLLIENYHKKK